MTTKQGTRRGNAVIGREGTRAHRPVGEGQDKGRSNMPSRVGISTMTTPPFDTEASSCNVVIVDPHPIGREGLRACLDANGCAVVAAAADGNAAVLAAMDHPGATILVSANLARPNIAATVRRLRQTAPESEIVVVGVRSDAVLVRDLINQGVGAVVGADAPTDEYWNAVHAVRFGALYLSGPIASQVFSAGPRRDAADNPYGLTAREIDILRSLSEGMSNKEVARRLDLSVRTVETHRLNIRRKTNSHNLSDLVRVSRMLEADGALG